MKKYQNIYDKINNSSCDTNFHSNKKKKRKEKERKKKAYILSGKDELEIHRHKHKRNHWRKLVKGDYNYTKSSM